MQTIVQMSLQFTEGSSDKVYLVQIVEDGGQFSINFQYGRRGSSLTAGNKGSGLDAATAEKIYTKLVNDKMSKGYKPMAQQGSASAYTPALPPDEAQTDFRPQLLNMINSGEELEAFFTDDSWIMQEKKDGKRITIRKDETGTIAINRKGKIVAVPQRIIDAINKTPRNVTIDGELIGDTWYAFDLIAWGLGPVQEGFGKRLAALLKLSAISGWGIDHETDAGQSVQMVPGWQMEQEKRDRFALIRNRKGEGVVFKKTDALYTPSRPNSGGSQRKYKFTAQATCLVNKRNGSKRSVELMVGASTSHRIIGNVIIPANFAVPQSGKLVEIRYLHCFPEGSLYQPIYLGPRDDKDEPDQYDTLKFKQGTTDEDDEA